MSGDVWPKRRAEVEQQIAQTARSLVELARNREMAGAQVLRPPGREYARFAARFPFTETEDQARAIKATLQDLASGRPMDRLVCRVVGFGKTEVALRTAESLPASRLRSCRRRRCLSASICKPFGVASRVSMCGSKHCPDPHRRPKPAR